MSMVKKQCRRCKKRKLTATQFYKCPSNSDGFRHYCKECGKAMSESYRSKKAPRAPKAAKVPARRKPVPAPTPAQVVAGA